MPSTPAPTSQITDTAKVPLQGPVQTAGDNEFSINVIPDTQILSQTYPDKFIKMANWIVDNKKSLNIQMVLHLGDVVNKGAGDEAQYRKAKTALDIIDKADIPMVIAIGNHD